MLGCCSRGNNDTVPRFERDNLPVETNAQGALKHIADMAYLAPVLGSLARFEIDQSNLMPCSAVDLLPHIRAELFPLHGVEADLERTHTTLRIKPLAQPAA